MYRLIASGMIHIALIVGFSQFEVDGAEVEPGNKGLAEIWKSFTDVNRVWLAPSPERLSYTVTATLKRNDRSTELTNRVWLDGDKARWEMDKWRSNVEATLPSYAYALVIEGEKEVYLDGPKSLLNQKRAARDIHALKQGITWNTAMHAAYRRGLPKNARIAARRRDSGAEVVVVELDFNGERSSVGLGMFHTYLGQRNSPIGRVLLHLNVTDMTPLLEEYVGQDCKIVYSGEFLRFGKQKAPSKITHISKLHSDNSEWLLEGKFQKHKDLWILDKALNIQNGKVVTELRVSNISTEEIDPSMFATTQK